MLAILRVGVLLAVLATLVAVPPGNATADTWVTSNLTEFAISAAPSTAPDGTVTFQVFNAGALPHNFIVVDTDLPADSLPLTPDQLFVDENQLVIPGRTVEFFPGGSQTLSVSLTPGNYVLICNNDASHYTAGMYLPFYVSQSVQPTQPPPIDGSATPSDGQPGATPQQASGSFTNGSGGRGATEMTAGVNAGITSPNTGFGEEERSVNYWWLLPIFAAAGVGLLAAGTAIRRRAR